MVQKGPKAKDKGPQGQTATKTRIRASGGSNADEQSGTFSRFLKSKSWQPGFFLDKLAMVLWRRNRLLLLPGA